MGKVQKSVTSGLPSSWPFFQTRSPRAIQSLSLKSFNFVNSSIYTLNLSIYFTNTMEKQTPAENKIY